MNINKHFRTVVFDVDGTLFDTLPSLTHAANAVLQSRGMAAVAPGQLKHALNEGLSSLFRQALSLNMAAPTAEDLLGFEQECVAVYRERWLATATLFPGVTDCLKQLGAQGLHLAICTNRDRASTQVLLQSAGLDKVFGVIVGMGDAARPKPAPDPLLAVLAQLSLPAAEALFVGDSLMDAACAEAAGVRLAAHLEGYAVRLDDLHPHVTHFSDYRLFTQWVLASLPATQELRYA